MGINSFTRLRMRCVCFPVLMTFFKIKNEYMGIIKNSIKLYGGHKIKVVFSFTSCQYLKKVNYQC